jgi:hypothetical protein
MIGIKFLNRLTQEQRQAVFDLAVMLANADQDFAEEEHEYLKAFSETYDIDFELDKSHLNIDDVIVPFESRQSKIILLQELITLSYKDGHFGREEQDQVFMLSQKLGINDPALMLSIEKWVRQGFDWQYEGEQLIES